MTEQLIYKIYKITNSVDDKIYIGSTRQSTLKKRMNGHISEVRKNNPKILSQHMRTIGIDNCRIELIKEICVPNSKTAKIIEQIELWRIPISQRLNAVRANIPNIYYRTNINAKRASRRAYYHRQKQNPVWLNNERIRNRNRMRLKRQSEQESAAQTERGLAQA